MSRSKKSSKSHRNYVPGEVRYYGKKEIQTNIEIFDFSKDHCEDFQTTDIEEAFRFRTTDQVTWINVNGLNNTKEIQRLGEYYDLHPLVQEDIVTTNQRPKIDEYDNYVLITFRMLFYDASSELVNEHVSLVMGNNYVVTFQEADGDVFDSIRERLVENKGRIRSLGADYLMFALLDAVVDAYFVVLENLGEKIESIEEQLFESEPSKGITGDIQLLKKEVLRIRRATTPLREVINKLDKAELEYMSAYTDNYVRDLYDHIIQVNEGVDLYREMIWGLMDMHMTNISNRMNEIMKVLTIMASIFIPLTFMAGIYGMNFEHMPELSYKYGYLVFWIILIIVFILMLWYFRKKKWL